MRVLALHYEVEGEAVPQPGSRGRHLKRRALKNKALAISFNKKDLRDYVTGFHKRKKKRRKEAHRKQEEVLRRKRNEERKKRKLERELALYGGIPPTADSEPDEVDEYLDEDGEQVESIAGIKTYESADLKVTVVTSEISPEEESHRSEKKDAAESHSVGADKRHNVPINNRKPFKKVSTHTARPKPRSKRDKEKGKKRGKK